MSLQDLVFAYISLAGYELSHRHGQYCQHSFADCHRQLVDQCCVVALTETAVLFVIHLCIPPVIPFFNAFRTAVPECCNSAGLRLLKEVCKQMGGHILRNIMCVFVDGL